METHTAIFKGVIREIVWEYYKPIGYALYASNHYRNVLEEEHDGFRKIAEEREMKIFWSGEIAKPIFEVGEQVYINELDLLVRITSKYRTTDGEVMYETNYVIKDVESENIEKSRQIAIYRWFTEEYGDYKTFEGIKFLYEPKNISKPEPEESNLEVEEKPKEKTWFGWLNFFKND